MNMQRKQSSANSSQTSLSGPGRFGRDFLKRFMYSQMALRSGFMIAIGKEDPLLKFTVEKDPPSTYWVYKIKGSEKEDLVNILDLPSNLSLCPIRCLEADEPDYFIVVNAYRVSGLANGIRAEWSVFVRDTNDIPRYMVIDARSSTFSVDPIDIITRASSVSHEQNGQLLMTNIGEEDAAFKSSISILDSASTIKTASEWVTANDTIYWRNGIYDRTYYDASLADAKMRRVAASEAQITDNSFWSRFVNPDPVHILILNEAIEFVISPWANI